MKTIRDTLAVVTVVRPVRAAGWFKAVLIAAWALAASVAGAQPVNDLFTNAIVLGGSVGTTNGDNTLASMEACESTMVNTPLYPNDPITNSVWFKWTAATNGTLEVDTAGSDLGLDFVLSVWTSANASPTMCDGSLTNVASDDYSQGSYSQVSIPVTAGTTYYIAVSSYDDGSSPNDNLGIFALNWSETFPTLASGAFKFTSTSYVVSETDSQWPRSPSVNPSISGARVTVTRPEPAHGRVMVDYAVTALTYTNRFATNFFGTNLLTMFVDTNGIISMTNYYTTNVYILSSYESWNGCSFQQAVITNGYTNGATLILNGIYAFVSPVTSGPLSPIPTSYPVATNSVSSGLGFSFTTNIFDFSLARTLNGVTKTNGTTYTNGLVYYDFQNFYTNTFVTNYYGTNIYLSYTAGGALFSTNYYFTNVVFISNFYTNSVYTNGGSSVSVVSGGQVISGLSYSAWAVLNASNRQFYAAPTGLATNLPPPLLGSSSQTSDVFDSNGNEIISQTNTYNYLAIGSQPVSSAAGITLTTNTLTFNDYEMSKDIVVSVAQVPGPDAPIVSGIPSYANISLSNPRLDPLEDANSVIAPTVDPVNGIASISALSTTYSPYGWGIFNFERSTFRVNRNQGTATISVNRYSGDPKQSVSVDYVIDPTAPLNGGCQPPCNFVGGRNPANTFPLQAGSDYATPDSDYTPVSGTLNWAAGDYNPKQINIPILNNGTVEFNEDMLIQLYNPTPDCSAQVPSQLGEVNAATLTILFDNSYVLGGKIPGQQPAGALDRTWNKDNSNDSTPPYLLYPGTTPGVGGAVYAAVTQPDGKSVIAGSFVSFDSTPYNRIVRTLPNGYQDPTFLASPNSGANDLIDALALQPDGKIIIGGNFTAFNGYNRHYVARLNTDGSVDTAFNPGLGANGRVWAIAMQPDGRILIAGEFTSYNGTAVNEIARLNLDGSLDTSFSPGTGADGIIYSVAVDGSGRVVIGGDFANVDGVTSGAVARLNADGSLDTTFTPGIGTFNPDLFVTDPIHAVAIQSDGKIVVGGSFSYYNLVSYNGLARLNTDGTLDLTFKPGTGTMNPITGVADSVYSIVIQPDNNILFGGNFTTFNQTRRIGLARVYPDGSLDTSFMDTAYNQFAGVPNQYYNPNVVAATYPYRNTRNVIYTVALETSSVSASNIIIGGSFEQVGGGNTRDDIHPRSNVARVIGGITPGPGNIEFADTAYSVANSEGHLYVSLVRTNFNLGIASATFSTNTAAPGPGVASGGDFSLANAYRQPTWDTAWYNNGWTYGTGSFGPNYGLNPPIGNGAATGNPNVYINVFNPGNIVGNLSANFALSAPFDSNFALGGQYIPLGVALGTVNSAPLTIIDSNVKPGVLGFSSISYYVIENGGNATITLTRTNGSDNSVTVWYATSNGTATNGVDYVGVTNQIFFDAGVTSNSFTITTKGHYTSVQPDKTVNLRLYTPSGGATLGVTNATLTLINPNYAPGHISFSLTNYVVNENAGSAVITVNRLGGSATTLGVTLVTQDGTAFNGTNYIGTTNVLFWNSLDATPRTITIPVKDDGVVTPNLLANLKLINSQVNGTNNPTPLTFGGTNATLTVANVDSAGSIQFSSANYAVKKYGGYALIPVTRTGGSVGTVSVSFTTADDTALQGVNYTFVTNTLTFTNGELGKYINVPILPTGATNGTKDLFLQLSNPTGFATLGTPNPAKLYIIDSDSINEPPGSPDPTYSSFAGFNGNVFALKLQPNNQLLVGGDFTMANGVTRTRIARLNSDGSLDPEFSLPSSSMGADASVRSIAMQADGRILVGGFFTNFNSVARRHIARVNPDGTLDTLFNPGSGADNPVYSVAETFVSGASKILIGGAFTSVNGTTFNGVGRLNTDGTPDTSFNPAGLGANATVYALAVQSDGRIVIAGDFTSVNGITNINHIARLNADGSTDTNFNISAGGASDSVRAIALQLDGKIVIGGLFTNVNGIARSYIARLNPDGSVDTSFNPQPGANDAVFALGIQTDNRIVVGGEFTTCTGVTRNRVTRLNPDGSVDSSINFGTGANDFVAAIAVQEDAIAGLSTNVPDEKLIIGGGFTTYDSLSHPHIARIFGGSIGGSGAFQFSAATYQVDEKGTNISITVLRTGGTTNAPTGDVFVTANIVGGSAVAGVNYTNLAPYLLDFPLGEVLKTFIIPVMDDGVVTTNLTLNLALANPTAPAQIGNQPTAVLTILNDDTTVSFSSATYSVPKNIVSGVAAINIVRKGGVSGTATVNFTTTTAGTATIGTDYAPVTQTVTFNPGVSNVVVNIPINNNGLPEGNRTVTMQLANAGGTTLANPTNAVLTIIDTVNAPGQLAFSSPTYSITEGGGIGYTNAYLTVIRTNGSSGTVSVGYYTVDGTAQAVTKYMPTNGMISFADGETSKTIVIPVVNTSTAEGPETVFIVLTNAGGGATLTVPSTAMLTILNTNTGIAFALAANSYTEPSGLVAGQVLLNVIRYNNTNGTTTVNYSTTNGTATDGVDFDGVFNGVLTFNPGESVKAIAITTHHDTNVTGDLSFTVGLANPSASAQLTPPSYTVVTAHDADAGISFLTSQTSVARNAGFVLIPVVCSNTNVEPVSVHYSTGGGSAVAGSDYTATSGTLSFTNGLTVNYFYVPILLNNAVQSNRTFNVTLSAPTPPGVLVSPYVETVTIIGTNTPIGLSFSTPIIINGLWGSTNADNSASVPESGDPNIAGQVPIAPVWFQWTAPVGYDGEVTLDTINSAGTNGSKLDTVMGVFTGSSLSALSQVAANDDLYPLFSAPYGQINYSGQNIFNTNVTVTSIPISYIISNGIPVLIYSTVTNTAGQFQPFETSYYQPFGGPSGLRFNAKGGTTYYIAVDTKASLTYTYVPYPPYYLYTLTGTGKVNLNWAYHPAGVFRFATEDVDQTGVTNVGGNPILLYSCAETEGVASRGGFLHGVQGPVTAREYDSTVDTYYRHDVNGLLVTVTRVAGSSGRMLVDYTTMPATNLLNGDIPAIAGQDYSPVTNTLIFNDYEMSKTIVIPIFDDASYSLTGSSLSGGLSQPNRDFLVVLSNARRDPAESGIVSQPRVDSVFGTALCRILDCDIDPEGPSYIDTVVTNITALSTNIFTNTVVSLVPTNAIFNFSKKNYRVPRDVEQWLGGNIPVTVYVNRSGTNQASKTLHWRIDNYFLDKVTQDDDNIYFPLQPGSDYAVPTPADTAGIRGTNSDFAGVGGDSGTLTFPYDKAHPYQSQPIHININNNKLTEFNKDIRIGIYEEDSNGGVHQDGMVAECTVTILFDDDAPPAGSVDQYYNPDFGVNLATLNKPLGTSVLHPGTDPFSEVYAVALATNDQAIIAGSFSTYTDGTNTYTVNGLARLNLDGSFDTTFNPGSGVNVFPGGEYIRSVAMYNDKIVIGGDFTSYRGTSRKNIARVNPDGSLDTSFNVGAGANGTVWSVLAESDGKVLIGGEFTTYNGAAANHIARLNADGTLDTTFNSSNIISGPVYAMAHPPATVLNFNRTASGGPEEDVQVLNLGPLTSGTLTVNYDFMSVPDDMRIFYGTTNTVAGTGVLIYDSTLTNGAGTIILPFGPTNFLTASNLVIVMNQGGSTNSGTAWDYNAAVSVPSTAGLVVGGHFTVAGQTFANIAELNLDGSLNPTFSPGTGPDDSVYSVAWQLDNKIIAGGAFHTVSGLSYNRLARFNSDGSLDTGFYIGTGADNLVNSVIEQPLTGLIYVGGSFTMMNGTHRLGYARLNADGTVDTSFLDAAYNQFAGLPRTFYGDAPGTVYSSAIQGDGNVIIGGSFQQVGGGQADFYVRYYDEIERGLAASTTNQDLWVSEGGTALEPKSRDGVRNRNNVARLIGGATPGPGNIGMASPSYSVNKTQATEPVTLVRLNGSLGYASANFAVVPGLAQSGVDYSYNSTAPLYPIGWEYSGPTRMHSDGLFGPNGLMQDRYGELWKYGFAGPASANVNILNNSSRSGNVTAAFQLSNPSGADQFYLGGQNIPLGVALGQSLTPLTIIDNAHLDGTFSFASPVYVGTNSPMPVSIVRSNGSYGVVQVSYQTTTNGSTAVVNTDYWPTNGVLTFANAQMSNSFAVTILNNSYISPQEKAINLQLYNIQDLSSGKAQLGLTNAVVRVINPNFAGFLSFSTNAYYGKVSDGKIYFTVTRTVGSKGTLTLQYRTADGTAHNGADYFGVTNTLTWNNGDVSSRVVSIALTNNSLIGPNKQFVANLFNATLNGSNNVALFGAVTNAVFAIINDNNYGTFQFSSAAYQYNENGGLATVNITRNGSALGTASINVATANGTAFAGTNYVATNAVVTFNPGDVVKSFNVRLLADGKTNPPPANFYFGVALSSPSAGSTVGVISNTLVHIVDADSYNQQPGAVDPSFDASVNASVLALIRQSSGQVIAGGSFTVADGTAMNRLARFNADGTLDTTFLNGLAGMNGSVNALVNQSDDRVVIGGAFTTVDSVVRQRIARLQTDGSLDNTFNSGAGADGTVFALAEAFVNGAHTIYAGGAFNYFNSVSSPGLVRLDDNGAVDTSFATGLGVVGTVYAVAVYPSNSVYNAGKVLVAGSFTNFNGVAVANLIRLNPDGSLDTNFVQNISADGAVRALAIQLDDKVLLGGDFTNVNDTVANHIARLNVDGTLDAAFNTAVNGGLNGTVNAIAVQADNRIVLAGQFSRGNGVTRQDITRLLPTGAVDPTINFGLGANGAINAVLVQADDGNLVIGGDFTQFNGVPRDHIARLFGGSMTGSGAFQFTSGNYSIDELGSFATVIIHRTGGTSGTNADGSGDVFVAFTTTNGSAKAGVNYTYTTNYVDFPVGEVSQTVFVPVMDDGVITSNLTVNLSLSNPSPGTGLGDQATAVLTIINDDSVVEFASPTYTVPKNVVNGFASINVIRYGSASGTATVDFHTGTNGTAVIGTDYYPTNAAITFGPGQTSQIVQVPIINNTIPEGNRTVTLLLSNVVNSVLVAPSNAVLTIIDTVQAPGNLFFTATNFSANSSAGLAYVTVGRTNGTSGAVSVTYTTMDGTATNGLNYIAATNTVTLNDGDTNKTFTINLVNNPSVPPQGPVSFGVFLSNPTGGAGLIAPTNTTVTIYNTNAVFAFTMATNTAAENTGSATVIVQRFNNTNIVSSVHYATADGTAFAGVNYSNTSGTLTFGVGESFKSVSIPLINQSNVTDVAFNVYLSSPVNGRLIAPTNTVVVEQAAAAGISFPTNTMTVQKSAGFAVIDVVCSNPRVEPTVNGTNPPLQVAFMTVDGTAKAGINYNPTNGILTFTNGVATNHFIVPIFNDQTVSGDMTFSVVLTNVTTPGKITPYGTETVVISESNAGLRFSQASYSVYKNGVTATITVYRTGYTNNTVSVNYQATNGTAISGQNFYATNGVLTFTNGVTSQSFNVALIANSQVQPNLYALLQLSNPTNAQLVNPSAATLTILENGGSYVIPAGAQVVTNYTSHLNDGIIGSNDTVQVLFAFRDSAGLNVTNLIANLLVTNGVTAPTPSVQTYGPLKVYQHSVSMPFTFTAHGTNTLTISPTFALYDNDKYIGPATFTFTVGSWTTTFANTNTIVINDNAAASLYPSIINVTNLGNTLVKATVTLTNLSHAHVSDVDVLVVSPTTNTLVMAHVGATTVNHVTLTFDDAATNSLPQNGVIVTGTNKPTQFYPVKNFP